MIIYSIHILKHCRGPEGGAARSQNLLTKVGDESLLSLFSFFDSEESFGPDGISLRGALEAGGP